MLQSLSGPQRPSNASSCAQHCKKSSSQPLLPAIDALWLQKSATIDAAGKSSGLYLAHRARECVFQRNCSHDEACRDFRRDRAEFRGQHGVKMRGPLQPLLRQQFRHRRQPPYRSIDRRRSSANLSAAITAIWGRTSGQRHQKARESRLVSRLKTRDLVAPPTNHSAQPSAPYTRTLLLHARAPEKR